MNLGHVVAAVLAVVSFPSVVSADERVDPDPVGDGHFINASTKLTVDLAGVVVGSIISVDGLEHSHETVDYKDPEDQPTRYRPNAKTHRIDIIRLWNPTSLVPWPHADDGTLTPSPLTVVAENVGADGAPIDTTFKLTGCLPTLQDFGWRVNVLGGFYVVEGDRIECQTETITLPTTTNP